MAHKDFVDETAVVARHDPQRSAANGAGTKDDRRYQQRDPSAIDDSAPDVSALLVGSEQMFSAATLQPNGRHDPHPQIALFRILIRQQRRKDGERRE